MITQGVPLIKMRLCSTKCHSEQREESRLFYKMYRSHWILHFVQDDVTSSSSPLRNNCWVQSRLFLRKARTRRLRQGFLLIELVIALGLFLLMVGVGTRLVADMVRMNEMQLTRSTLLWLAQSGAEASVAQRQRFADNHGGVVHVIFKTQRTGHNVQRTKVCALCGQQSVQLVVVD